MALILPFRPSIGRYRFVSVINEIQYIFVVRWNSRDEAWYFDVLEYDETPIVSGVKIVLGTYLARWSNHDLFLQGVIFARSSVVPHEDAKFDTLGTKVTVFYLTRADLANQMLGSIQDAS